MLTRTVAVAMVGVSERMRAALALVLERSVQREGIRYVALDKGGNSDALVILLGPGLTAPEPARWGPAVVAMLPLSDLLERTLSAHHELHLVASFSDLLRALDELCLRYFDALPERADATVSAGMEGLSTGASRARADPLRRRRSILLVSDGQRQDTVFFENLARDEIDFELVNSPDDALRMVALDRFDLAILDLDSLESQAYRLCSELTQRRSPNRMPVLMMGHARGVLEQWRGRFAGCDGFIPGPEAPSEFRAGVAKMLHTE